MEGVDQRARQAADFILVSPAVGTLRPQGCEAPFKLLGA